MKIPKKIKIKGVNYRVEQVDLDGYLGLCWWKEKLIQLSPEQSEEELWLTFAHESFHAFLYEFGYRDSKLEENFVVALESFVKKYFVPRGIK